MLDTSGSPLGHVENWSLLITRYIVFDPFHPVIHLQSHDRDTTYFIYGGVRNMVIDIRVASVTWIPRYLEVWGVGCLAWHGPGTGRGGGRGGDR